MTNINKPYIHQYIYPIFGEHQTIIGQGFIANGFFITAAHVLKSGSDAYIIIKNKTITLSKETALFVSNSEDSQVKEESLDLAIYDFKNIESPLTISSYLPKVGDRLNNHCVIEVAKGTSNFIDSRIIFDTKQAKPLGIIQGNYFVCECVRHKGSSGSPLIMNNYNVVGIMIGGYENDNCVFLSSIPIMKVIKQILTQ